MIKVKLAVSAFALIAAFVHFGNFGLGSHSFLPTTVIQPTRLELRAMEYDNTSETPHMWTDSYLDSMCKAEQSSGMKEWYEGIRFLRQYWYVEDDLIDRHGGGISSWFDLLEEAMSSEMRQDLTLEEWIQVGRLAQAIYPHLYNTDMLDDVIKHMPSTAKNMMDLWDIFKEYRRKGLAGARKQLDSLGQYHKHAAEIITLVLVQEDREVHSLEHLMDKNAGHSFFIGSQDDGVFEHFIGNVSANGYAIIMMTFTCSENAMSGLRYEVECEHTMGEIFDNGSHEAMLKVMSIIGSQMLDYTLSVNTDETINHEETHEHITFLFENNVNEFLRQNPDCIHNVMHQASSYNQDQQIDFQLEALPGLEQALLGSYFVNFTHEAYKDIMSRADLPHDPLYVESTMKVLRQLTSSFGIKKFAKMADSLTQMDYPKEELLNRYKEIQEKVAANANIFTETQAMQGFRGLELLLSFSDGEIPTYEFSYYKEDFDWKSSDYIKRPGRNITIFYQFPSASRTNIALTPSEEMEITDEELIHIGEFLCYPSKNFKVFRPVGRTMIIMFDDSDEDLRQDLSRLRRSL